MSSDSLSIISPSNVAGTSENINSAPCGICRRQFSRYTCPKCNLPYCSLTCFRSPAHTECSESFYRKELETDIHSAPSKTAEERLQMLELLKRFEEENAEDLDGLTDGDSDEEDEDDTLARRLAHVDLTAASYEDIWAALTSAERDRFLKALDDPAGATAQQLLASEELETQAVEPWWDRPSDYAPPPRFEDMGTPQRVRRFGDAPHIVDIPPSVRRAAEGGSASGPSLLYNICTVLLAYAYITRHLSASPLSSLRPADAEHAAARRLFAQLVPFLTERRATTVLPSLSAVITHLWSRFAPDTMTPAFFALVMRDVATLLRPASVVALAAPASDPSSSTSAPASHPSAHALRALSDIVALFQPPPPPPSPQSTHAPGPRPAAAKALFYAARVCASPAHILSALADELAARAGLMEREGALNAGPPPAADPSAPAPTPQGPLNMDIKRTGSQPEANRARIGIEELPAP